MEKTPDQNLTGEHQNDRLEHLPFLAKIAAAQIFATNQKFNSRCIIHIAGIKKITATKTYISQLARVHL